MRIKRNVSTLLILFSLISLACSLGGLLPGKGPAGQHSGGGIYDENGQPVQVEAPPEDIMTVMNEMVAAGEIDEAEALIAGLKVLAGENPDSDLYAGKNADFFEGTEMLDQAANFLATSKDKNDKAEIERLMTAILPPRDNMDRFSAPEGAGSGGQQKLIRPAPPGEETACRALWSAGFPKDADSLVCQLYRDFDWGGHQYRVYYPDSRHSDPGFMQYVQDAEDALNDSLNKYSRFTSNIGDIDIIFALIQLDVVGSSGLPRGLTDFSGVRNGKTTKCRIILYPEALSETQGHFKQVVAHEVFHCLQGMAINWGYANSAGWYIEGMATYFSNVVYPASNLEHRFQPRFDYVSIEKSIFDMRYESTTFFQYLGNVWGDQRVFDLLGVLDRLGGPEEHANNLVSYGLTQQVFNEFGQAYVDGKITDPGGGNLPITLYYRNVYTLDASQNLELDAKPFHLSRYLLKYKDKDKTEYTITNIEGGLTGRNISEPWPDGGPWRPLPTSFTSRCGADGDKLLLTTVETGGTYDLKLDVTVGRTFSCCLVGTWMQDTPEIESHVRAALPSGMTLVSLSGQFWLVIDDRGNMTFTPRDYLGVIQAGDSPPMEIGVTGVATSTYEIPEGVENTIVITPLDSTFEVIMGSGGGSVAVPLGPEAFAGGPFSEGGRFQYQCNDTTLTAMIPAGVAPFSTSSFQRVSEVPATPIPDEPLEEPGGPPGLPPLDTTEGGGTADCSSVQAQGFSATGDHVQWTLRNDGTAAVTIAAISLNWPATNGAWNGIVLDGTPLWSGSQPPSLARIESGWSGPPEAFTLEAGAAADLVLSFASGSTEPSGYILVIDLADGCIISDVK